MVILALDPGTTETGWCRFDGRRVLESGVLPNDEMLRRVGQDRGETLAIEMMRARGMPMSNDAMDTLVWTGRFLQTWHRPEEVLLVPRVDIKLQICGSARAKDPNVRQAVIDLIGEPGTKAKPGNTHGVKSHAWAALAVAVCVVMQRNPTVPATELFRQPEVV